MSCNVRVDTTGIVLTPYDRDRAGVPGGQISGSVKVSVTCENERASPEIKDNQPTAYILEWLRDLGSDRLGDPIYEAVNIEDTQEDRVGRVNITSSWRIGPGEIGYMVNGSTSSDGQNTFKLNVMCRCNKDEAWSPKLVDVTISF